MIVSELIAELQKCESTATVCVNNQEVYTCEQTPAHYNGHLQKLILDPDLKEKCYSICRAKFTDKGNKVNLLVLGIDDIILDDPDIPIELDVPEHSREILESNIAQWRAKARNARI